MFRKAALSAYLNISRLQTCSLFVAFGLAGTNAGCVAGSLATDTGFRPPGFEWSVDTEQQVHVGEEVRFDFVLHDWSKNLLNPIGIADYCATIVQGERIEVDAQPSGHFQFSHKFDGLTPGERINIRVDAYRQRDDRDFMYIRDRWIHTPNSHNLDDKRVASASIRLTVYAAAIELSIVRPPDDLDPETGVLRIRRTDGSTKSFFIDRPGRRGFTVDGPTVDGYYRFRFRPRGNELNSSGTTAVEIEVYDLSGNPHYAETILDTP